MNTDNKKISRTKSSTGFYYSFLTLVLLLCLVQIGFGAILNISKTISYKAKISTLTKIKENAEAQNEDLKENIKLFSSSSKSLEGIARNNLKMAGEDEVLILINNNQTQNTVKKKKRKKLGE